MRKQTSVLCVLSEKKKRLSDKIRRLQESSFVFAFGLEETLEARKNPFPKRILPQRNHYLQCPIGFCPKCTCHYVRAGAASGHWLARFSWILLHTAIQKGEFRGEYWLRVLNPPCTTLTKDLDFLIKNGAHIYCTIGHNFFSQKRSSFRNANRSPPPYGILRFVTFGNPNYTCPSSLHKGWLSTFRKTG